MLTGFQKVKIIAINPDQLWLEKELSEQEVPEYYWEDRQGVKNCLIDIYFKDNKDNIFKTSIYLTNKEKKGKTNNCLYVNQVGDSQWVTDESQLFEEFRYWTRVLSWGIDGEKIQKYKVGAKPFEKEVLANKDYHVSKEGEDILLQFLKSFYDYNKYDIDANVYIELEDLFEGDFSKLQLLINSDKDYHLVIFTYLSEKLEQKVLNYFFPLNFFRDVLNNMQISNIYKKQYQDFLKRLEYTDGYWDICKLKEFKPTIKKVEQNDSEY